MIFEQDIKKQRAQLWHTAETSSPLRTLDDARQFLNAVGFCLAYPVHPPLLAPTFIGAYAGSEEKLPTAKQAFADDKARAATELVVRLLSEKSAFEVAFGEDASLLVSAAEFPYFYALVGDRNPKAPPSPGLRNEQALTTHTFEIIDQHGPISEDEMRRKLGREISRNAIEKVLHTLWSKLRITRVDPGLDNGEPVEPVWDLMHRFAPQMVNRGKQISAAEALSALISKYLEVVIVAEQKDIETFFGRLVPRSKVTEVCKALLSAQEFSYVQVSGKNMLRLALRGAAEEIEAVPTDAAGPKVHKVRPWQAREQGKKAAEEKRERFTQRQQPASSGAFKKFSRDRKPFGGKKSFAERKSFGERKPFGDRQPFGERKQFGDRPRFDKDRPPFGQGRPPRAEGDRQGFKRFGDRKPFGERKPYTAKQEGDAPAKPFGPRKSFRESGKSFAERKSGARARTGDSQRPPFKKPFGERKSFGDRKPYGERKSFGGKKPFSERPPRKDFGDYPPRDRSEGAESKKPFSGKRSFGDKKPFGKKPFGDKRSFGKRFDGPKSFGDKKRFPKRTPSTGERSSAPPWAKEKKPRREEPSE